MKNFEAGKSYQTRSICNWDSIIKINVISRTAKTIKAKTDRGIQTFRVSLNYEGHEMVKPWGSYSMSPIITAEKVI